VLLPLCFLPVLTMRRKMAGTSAARLSRFLTGVQRAAGLSGQVDVLVSDDRELRGLNRRYRSQDRATDVLSFPAPARLQGRMAGDIAISADYAARNARRLGHSLGEELKVLILHGVLHLAGYDHESDDGRMARVEASLRRQFQLPPALIQRTPGRRSPERGRKRRQEPAGRRKR
jgi:probable rRNA maturation factor